MSAREAAEVVVVGGGVLGCSVAWALARRGVERVVLLERATVGSQTTSRAASILSSVASHPAKSALFQETWATMAALEEELGERIGVHEVGAVHVGVSEQSALGLDEHRALAIEAGEAVEAWSVDQTKSKVPWLDIPEGARSLFLPRAGYVDSYLLATGFERAAKARGVEVRTGVEVLGLLKEGERIVGVQAAEGELRADWVVNCAGPWAGILSAGAGWHLPMAPVRSQYWITEARDEFEPGQPVVFLPDIPAYARGEVGGLLFGLRGGPSPARDPRALPEDLRDLHFAEDPEGWETLGTTGEAFARFCPALESVGIAHYVSGPSSYTPDNNFILGACPGVEGYLVAAGCCGSGVAASGGIARAISELVADGESSLDLEPFRADRFGEVDAFDAAWLERCSAARVAKSVG